MAIRREGIVIMKDRVASLLDVYTMAVIRIRALYAILLFVLSAIMGLFLYGGRIDDILRDMPVYSQLEGTPHFVLYFTMIILGLPGVVLSWISAVNIMVANKIDSIAHAKLIIVLLSISSIMYDALYFIVPNVSLMLSDIALFVMLFLFVRKIENLAVVRTIGTILLWHILLLVYGAILGMFVILPIVRLLLVR